MEKTLYEKMGGTYKEIGDYVLPNLTLPEKRTTNRSMGTEAATLFERAP